MKCFLTSIFLDASVPTAATMFRSLITLPRFHPAGHVHLWASAEYDSWRILLVPTGVHILQLALQFLMKLSLQSDC